MYEIVRIVPENERPTEKPIPPAPQCATLDPGTDAEWEIYWKARDSFYHGIELREIN